MADPKLYIHTDGTIRVNGLKDEESSSVINSATITVSIYKEIPLNIEQSFLEFDGGGTREIAAGDIIIGNTSSATAYIQSVELTAGIWASNTAEGKLFLLNQIGIFVDDEPLKVMGIQGALVKGGDSTGAVTIGGTKTKILVPNHGLTLNDHIRIQGSFSYEVSLGLDTIDDWQNITIAQAYVAEKFTGLEEVFIGLRNAKDISVATTGSSGNYKGTIPDSVKKLIKDSFYMVFFTITYGAFEITLAKRWEAEYYEGESS